MKKSIDKMDIIEVIERLKNGETMFRVFGEKVELCNGIMVYTTKAGVLFNPSISLNDGWYFEVPEKGIEVKIGMKYQTRSGVKAYVFNQAPDNRFAVVVDNEMPFTVSPDGFVSDDNENDLDLVAEWTEDKSKADEDKLEQLVAEGLSGKEIAQKIGFSYSYTMKLIRENNLNYIPRSRWSK